MTHAESLPRQNPDAKDLITVVIPAYNEELGIGDALKNIFASLEGLVAEVIVVDDGSTDKTAAIARASGARLISHLTNRGYGASLKTGIREASTEYVLTMDADGQHRAQDAVRLCEVLHAELGHDLIVGARTSMSSSPSWRIPGKWLLTKMAQYLVQQSIPDLNSGLRILRRETALKYVNLCPQGFSFSTTMTMAMLSRGRSVRFEPIQAERRVGTSSVKVRTGFETIMLVIRLATLFNPLRIFLPAAAFPFVVGVAWGIPYAIQRDGVTVGSMLAIVLATILFALGLISDQIAQLRLERFE